MLTSKAAALSEKKLVVVLAHMSFCQCSQIVDRSRLELRAEWPPAPAEIRARVHCSKRNARPYGAVHYLVVLPGSQT